MNKILFKRFCKYRHNCRYWFNFPPEHYSIFNIPQPYSCFKVDLWMELSKFRIYGPFFIEDNITCESYLNIFKTSFIPQVSCYMVPIMIFQHDEAPVNYVRQVREFLNKRFPQL